MVSRTSKPFPTFKPRTRFISVSSAEVFTPFSAATATMLLANASECSWVGMNAPDPVLTSITKASNPAASFLESIEAVINGMLSTVAVTSLIAYKRRSAGANSEVCPMMATPTFLTTCLNFAKSGAV